MAATAFDKYEGLGNDFVVLDATDERLVAPAAAKRICDRRLGVGADGVLLVMPPRTPEAAARMKVLNADGSVPEMCGNGLRCVAVHLARRSTSSIRDLVVDTDAGPRGCTLEDGAVVVDMGVVRYLGEVSVEVDGVQLGLSLADAGNPHAVLFGSAPQADIERLGPRISTHPSFPRGTNVELATVLGGAIDLVVWERGVGLTQACGTGACATVAAAAAKGLVPAAAPVDVRLPGGTLSVVFDVVSGRARLRGPARHVYSGVLEPRFLSEAR